MRTSLLALTAFTLAALPLCTSASAQGNWEKTYHVNAKPTVQVELDDASVHVQSCGGCNAVRIRVDWHGQDASRWRISQMQGGNSVHFELKRRQEMHSWFGSGWHGRSPEVTVDSPTETDLSAHTGNGSMVVVGLHGGLDLNSGDGSISTDATIGTLRLHTGDGGVQVHHAEGTLNGSTGDGSMNLEGRLSQIEARTGNGSVNVSLLPGSHLNSGSSITTGDGSISVRVPRDLQADVQASSGDGNIANSLPIAQGSDNDRHRLHGVLNGGGPTLRIHSGDGSIVLSAF